MKGKKKGDGRRCMREGRKSDGRVYEGGRTKKKGDTEGCM